MAKGPKDDETGSEAYVLAAGLLKRKMSSLSEVPVFDAIYSNKFEMVLKNRVNGKVVHRRKSEIGKLPLLYSYFGSFIEIGVITD